MPSDDVSTSGCPVCGALEADAVALGICPQCALGSVLSDRAATAIGHASGPTVPEGPYLIEKRSHKAEGIPWGD
jgi:hypothetical protein